MPFPSRSPFNLDKLTRFNPALIYGFDQESSEQPLRMIQHSIYLAEQRRDIFDAYDYAETQILPHLLQSNSQDLTPEILLSWLNALHLRLARTLAVDRNVPHLAGAFTNKRVQRWHLNSDFGNDLINYLNEPQKKFQYQKFDKLLDLAEKRGMEREVTIQFINLLKKIRDDSSIPFPLDLQDKNTPSTSYSPGVAATMKLAYLVDENKLNDVERKLADKFTTICMAPDRMPAAMKKFTEDMCVKWKACDGSIDQVADLAYELFYGLTEIHPYFNCNGRTATCILNIFLVSQACPSILIRNPNERDDDKSSYSLAIAAINTSPDLLRNHIKQRIVNSLSEKSYSDPVLAQMAIKQVEVARLLELIMTNFPGFNLELAYAKCVPKVPDLEDKTIFTAEEDERRLQIINDIAEAVKKIYMKLLTKKTHSTVIQRRYTNEEISTINDRLRELTSYSDWKASQTPQGLRFVLTLNDTNDIETAKKIASTLNDTGAMKAKIMNEPGELKRPVVKLSCINPEKLAAIASSQLASSSVNTNLPVQRN
jgi:hypothetical protein